MTVLAVRRRRSSSSARTRRQSWKCQHSALNRARRKKTSRNRRPTAPALRRKHFRSTCADLAPKSDLFDPVKRTARTRRNSKFTAGGSNSLMSSAVRGRLMRWFERAARPFPWRQDRDPYRIWISEVMLQQTTTAAVARRFGDFLEQFPDIQSLAAAEESRVLKAWEGLGYYRRARDLHAAARQIVDRHQGVIPNQPEQFEQLPGIGRYMLGAVLSQAFEHRLPVVEANTKRVLCRLFANKGDLESAETQRWLWQTAEAILPSRRVGDFNQALMELGALCCTVRDPNCSRCPLRRECQARQKGIQQTIPVRRRRPKIVQVNEICVVFRRNQRVLLTQRPPKGRWANMWEFPRVVLNEGESFAAGARRVSRSMKIAAKLGDVLTTIRYSVTSFRMTMTCVEASASDTDSVSDYYEAGRWLHLHELADYPVSSPHRRLASMISSQRETE